MKPWHALLVAAWALATGCTRPPETPKAAARVFLEANLRGDEEAARRVVVSPGSSDELRDLALHARFARSHARKRVVDAAVSRFGPAAAAAFPPPRLVTEELQALDSAPVEEGSDSAVIRVGREPLVARRVGFAWWKGWKIEIEAARSDAERERMKHVAAGAAAAADTTIRGIERGEYADARAAAAALHRHRIEQLAGRPPQD
jgi:hypothetical protein